MINQPNALFGFEAAAKLLADESAFVKTAMGHDTKGPEDVEEGFVTAARELMWLPSAGRYERAVSATNQDRLDSVKVGDVP